MAGSSIISKTTDMVISGREVEEQRVDYVCVLALVDVTAPRTLALPVRDAFDPRLPTSEVRVVAADSFTDLLAPNIPDVCVAVMGRDSANVAAGVTELAAAGVPVALVVESALDAPRLHLGETAASRVSIISATNEEVLLERLAEWLVGATDKGIAFAANFPFCRKAKVRELTNSFALENAKSTAKQGPGGELPSMAVNQARLALAIAAVNGQPLALGRIPEVLSAIGAGFGSRMFANKALGKIPLVGWMFQAGFGYLGTQATGRTLQHRFEKKELKAAERENPALTGRTSSSSGASHTLRERTSTTGGVGRILREGSTADMVVDAVRSRLPKREGKVVKSHAAAEVRLLPVGEEGGFLVYEPEVEQ